jgi:hypothetical protein
MQLLSVETKDMLNCLTKLVDKYPEASEIFSLILMPNFNSVQSTHGRWRKTFGRPAPALAALELSSGVQKNQRFPAANQCGGTDTRSVKKLARQLHFMIKCRAEILLLPLHPVKKLSHSYARQPTLFYLLLHLQYYILTLFLRRQNLQQKACKKIWSVWKFGGLRIRNWHTSRAPTLAAPRHLDTSM